MFNFDEKNKLFKNVDEFISTMDRPLSPGKTSSPHKRKLTSINSPKNSKLFSTFSNTKGTRNRNVSGEGYEIGFSIRKTKEK